MEVFIYVRGEFHSRESGPVLNLQRAYTKQGYSVVSVEPYQCPVCGPSLRMDLK